MFHQNVSAVPIVDNDGVLLGTISEKDIRVCLDQNNFPQILYNETSESFVQKVRSWSHPTAEGVIKSPISAEAVSIMESSTMEEVITLLHEYKIHRLWVVDGQKKVINVIALKDVLEEFNSF